MRVKTSVPTVTGENTDDHTPAEDEEEVVVTAVLRYRAPGVGLLPENSPPRGSVVVRTVASRRRRGAAAVSPTITAAAGERRSAAT